MCYHVRLAKMFVPRADWASLSDEDTELEKQYDEVLEQPSRAFHLNGFDHPKLPVTGMNHPQVIRLMEWGLIPHWAQNREKAAELQNFTLNATCENVFEKPSFKDSIYKQRCLILVSGFFENRHEGKLKYPYFIYPAQGNLFLMGGLASEWTDRETGEIVPTCAIITTPANLLMEKIHNTKKRMPLIFNPEQARKWLQPGLTREELEQLMIPCSNDMLHHHTISRTINQFRQKDTNVENISNEVVYPELALLDS